MERVTMDEVWQRARSAKCRLTEAPIATLVAASEANNDLPTVLRGVIDLVFLESAGWVIVDNKSDRVEASDIPALVSYYKPQIEAYGDLWEKVVGELVIERGLFFTHAGQYVTV